ncbi:ribonuclease H-like domain-containing protein, partial [Tanacetum coccineum]
SKFPHWVDAMNQEMNALLRNDTWELVDLPEGRKAMEVNGSIRSSSGLVSWPIFQLDVNNAFLYGDLDEIVYMRPPEGYFPSDNRTDKGVFLALLVYADDIIMTGNNVAEIENFKIFLKSKFMIKDLGKLKYFLGIKVVDTDKDNDLVLENISDYQKLMCKLIYLTNIRPDISYVVHCLSHFMHSPLKSHLKTAFKILRYLKGCPGLGIHFVKTSDLKVENLLPVNLYCDSNSAIKIAANPVFHERTKHLETDFHFVREIFLKGMVKTVKVDSANQIADIFTK